MSLLHELSRRNVFRTAVAYLAAAWLIIQVVETLFPVFGLGEKAIRSVVLLLAIGLLPALIASWTFQITPKGIVLDTRRDGATAPASTRIFDRIIIAMLTLGIAYFAFDKFVLDPARDSAAIDEAREAGRSDAIIGAYVDRSIVVLPFVNMSADADQEYFSDGLTEELLNVLARVREIRVISRSTAFAFKGQDVNISELAERLDVSHVLEGSVRKSGNRIRITAQLIEARTDTHLWSDTYDRTLDDVFEIQDEVSRHVTEALKVRLLGGPPVTSQMAAAAYDLYLQALYILNLGDGGDPEQARVLLEQALQIEPDNITIIAQLARAHSQLSDRDFLTDDRTGHWGITRDLVDRLVQLDPDAAQTNGWLGYLSMLDGELQTAARYYERAIAADATNLTTLRAAAILLGNIGRVDEAIAVHQYVIRRDPACGVCVYHLTLAYRQSGRHREAAAALEALTQWRTPDVNLAWSLGVAWLVAGEPDKALPWFERFRNGGSNYLGYLMALHDVGRLEDFEREFAEMRIANPDNYEGTARVYAWTGNNDKAFEYLEMMAKENPLMVARIDNDLYRKIKLDPRWSDLRERYGISPLPHGDDVKFNPPLPEEIRKGLEGSI